MKIINEFFIFRKTWSFDKRYILFISIPGVVSFSEKKVYFDERVAEFLSSFPSGTEFDPLAPKKKGEVLVLGFCKGAGKRVVPVRIKLGTIQKELLVFGNRYWVKKFGVWTKTEPEPFTEMEITWENAFGGPEYEKNPLGKGFAPIRTETGEEIWPLPNIEYPDQLIVSPKDRPEPAGFLPYEPTWPRRAKHLGTYDEKWLRERWPWFPEDFDPAFFNTTPPDQQIEGYFRGDEEIVIENMHPEKSVIQTRLPGIRTRCFVNQRVNRELAFKEVQLYLDTVWLIPHEEIGILIWHGAVPVAGEEAEDIEHVLVVSEKLDEDPKSLEHYYQLLLTKLEEEELEEMEEAEEEVMEESMEEPGEIELKKSEAEEPEIPEETQKLIARLEIEAKEAEKELREKLKKLGLDPDEFLKPAPPSTSKEDLPPEKLIEKLEKETKEAEGALKKELQKLGIDPEEFFHPSLKETKEKEISVKEMIESLRKAGVHDPQLEKEILEMEKETQKAQKELEELLSKTEQIEREEESASKEFKEVEKEESVPWTREKFVAAYQEGQSFKGADLSGLDLSGLDLRNIDLREALLEGTNFSQSDLQGADLSGALLEKAVFSETDLSRAQLIDCEASEAQFLKANLSGTDLSGGVFNKAQFLGAVLEGTSLKETDFSDSIWKECSLKETLADEADFTGAQFTNVNFEGASLSYADFTEARLKEVNFSYIKAPNVSFEGAKGENLIFIGADLTQSRADEETSLPGTDFQKANLTGACWEGADLKGANFEGAILDGANFSKADLTKANLYHASARETTLTKAVLDQARLLAANFFRAGFEEVSLIETDLRGANLYEVEFWKARIEGTLWEKANLKMTKLFGKIQT